MKGSGFGVRDWGFGRLIGLGLIVGVNSMALRGAPPTGESEPDLEISVRVYNYARVPAETLMRAEAEASRIFREAGVEMDWVDCPTSVAEAADYPACEPPAGARGVELRILPKAMALRVQSGREQLGLALPSARTGSASAAWVFYHRVEELAASQDADRAQILAHALAHEIGHLLLGPDRHSEKGIMRAAWGRHELQLGAQGQLLFSTPEAKIIQVEVRARERHAEASQAVGLPGRE